MYGLALQVTGNSVTPTLILLKTGEMVSTSVFEHVESCAFYKFVSTSLCFVCSETKNIAGWHPVFMKILYSVHSLNCIELTCGFAASTNATYDHVDLSTEMH